MRLTIALPPLMNRSGQAENNKRRRKRLERYPISHPSIAALMCGATEGERADAVMRRKCRELVAWAKTKGWAGPPYDPEILAGLQGIVVEEIDEEIDGDGRIFPRRGRVVIQHRSGRPIERQRFTIFHEIAHTLFPDVFEAVRRHTPTLDEESGHRGFENLCDIGAAELLMPFDDFSADLAGSKPCMQCADNLHTKYVASVDAALKRLLDLTSHPCAAVFLTDEGFKEFRAAPGRMLVRWMWKSDNFKGFIRPGTLLPKGSCLARDCADVARSFPSSRETWWINNHPCSWYVEPLRLATIPDNAEYPKVVAMIHSRIPR